MLISSHEIRTDDPSFFGKVFDHSNEENKNLLVEVYLYDYFLPKVNLILTCWLAMSIFKYYAQY